MKIFSTPYNPENNGIAERFNQTIINSAKTLIFWSKLSIDFWSYAVIYANFLYNITPRKGISNLIPNEVFIKSSEEQIIINNKKNHTITQKTPK